MSIRIERLDSVASDKNFIGKIELCIRHNCLHKNIQIRDKFETLNSTVWCFLLMIFKTIDLHIDS